MIIVSSLGWAWLCGIILFWFCFLHIASGERDFVVHSIDLTFGPSVTQQDVMITIIDNLCLEHNEQFNSFVSLTAADPAVTLSPSQASITIFDNDRTLLIRPPSIHLSKSQAKYLIKFNSMPLIWFTWWVHLSGQGVSRSIIPWDMCGIEIA